MSKEKVLVYYNEEFVGTLALTKDKKVAFQYDKSWINNGFSISPFYLPLNDQVFVPKSDYFKGLFGVFCDSLPDSWGELLLDRYMKKTLKTTDISVLQRLSIVGSSSIGALNYRPESFLFSKYNNIDYDTLSNVCYKVLNNNNFLDVDDVFKLGGSSGGARPKILTQIDNEYWMVKFSNHIDNIDAGLIEYEYALCAKECGICMSEVKLINSKYCLGYFATKRFDYKNEKKKHVISVAGLLEVDFRAPCIDYKELFKLIKILNDSKDDLKQMYKMMCFNVLTHNLDDHAKNFSFIYDCDLKKYRLAPFYDVTYSNTYYNEHTTLINGKGKDISEDDLIEVGVLSSLSYKYCRDTYQFIYEKTRKLINKFPHLF